MGEGVGVGEQNDEWKNELSQAERTTPPPQRLPLDIIVEVYGGVLLLESREKWSNMA